MRGRVLAGERVGVIVHVIVVRVDVVLGKWIAVGMSQAEVRAALRQADVRNSGAV